MTGPRPRDPRWVAEWAATRVYEDVEATKLWLRREPGCDPLWWLGGCAPSRGWTLVAEIGYDVAQRVHDGGTYGLWELQRLAVLIEVALED